VLNDTCVAIPDYEGLYWVSSDGYVTNGRKRLKTYTNNSGYLCLKLVNDAGRKSYLLHRLVAEAFIPNPDNKPEVNHDSGIKADCSKGNLGWMTSSENKLHALRTGLKVYNVPSLGINKGVTSKYHNVTWDKSRERWSAGIRINKKTIHQRRFTSEDEAALHVNWIIDELKLTDRPKNVII
jgi:hypothetical protein